MKTVKKTNSQMDILGAIALLVGTIIGAGIFGLPYVISKSGFLVGFLYLVFFGTIVIIVHLLYGEIILRTKEKHRLVGYADYYLGKNGKLITSFVVIFGLYGSLLVYIILAGDFLHIIFNGAFGGGEFVYSIIFFIFCALFVYLGFRLVTKGEILMSTFLIVIIAAIFVKAAAKIEFTYFATFDWKYLLFPYGVVLYSLGGSSALPEMQLVLRDNLTKMKVAIMIGTIIPIIIYLLFVFSVVGVLGENTTKDALNGLDGAIGNGVITLGAIFGLLSIVTSFLVIGLNLKHTFWIDYNLPHFVSWALACLVPFLFFVLGFTNFIEIISFIGSVMSGAVGIAIILIYQKAKLRGDRVPEYSLYTPSYLKNFIIIIFTGGIIYTIFTSILEFFG